MRDLGTGAAVRPRVVGTGAALALLTGVVTGCGQVHDDAVRRTATAFYAAHAAGEGTAACDALAPRTRSELEKSAGKPCPTAVLEEDVPAVSDPTDVRVFGTQAEVTWDGETTFLARFRGGWKVMAAACMKQESRPYDCRVSGG